MYVSQIHFKNDGMWAMTDNGIIRLDDLGMSIISFLGKEAVIEDGLTLRQFMESFIREADMLDVIFTHAADRNTPVTDMINFLQSDKMRKDVYQDDPPIKYLEVSWPAIDSDYCSQTPDFGGVGFREDGSSVYYSVSYTPINEIRDLPLRINDKMKIYDALARDYQSGEGRFSGRLTDEDLDKLFNTKFTVEREFRVKDVLEAIIYDVTFSGMAEPGETHTIIDRIRDAMDEIDSADAQPYAELDELIDENNDEE